MGIEQMPDINKIRKELDEKNAEMEEKERERIKEEYERLSGQEEPTEELIKDEIEESEKKKKEGAEKEIKDENIIQKLIPENVKAAANFKAAYEKGEFIEVKVKISSGEIEEGWVISNINPKTGEVTVLKSTSEKGKDRSFIDKIVTLEELKEWNKSETKDEVKSEEKPVEAKQEDKTEGKTEEKKEFEEKTKIIEDLDAEKEKLKEIDEKRRELDKKYEATNDQEERKKIEKEHEQLSKQAKKIDEKISELGKEELEDKKPVEKKEPPSAKAMEGRIEWPKEEKEDLEKKITKRFYDELKKIKDMPDNTGLLKKGKTGKCFELIDSWKDLAYLDNYKGIKNIISELDKLKPSIFLNDLKKAQITNDVAKSMALNYKEWEIEDKKKLKIIKDFVNKQSLEENFFYSKDETLNGIAQILALKDIPYKNNIDVIVKEIKDPDIKSKTIAKILEIENKSIKGKEQLLEDAKEKIKEKSKKERKKLNLWERYEKHMEPWSDNIFLSLWEVISTRLWGGDPEDPDYYLMQNELKLSRETPVWAEEETKEKQKKSEEEKLELYSKEISKILSGLIESFKEPEVRNRFQELIKTEQFQEIKDIIEKIINEKNEASTAAEGTKDSIQEETEVAESEEKKEKLDPWKSYKKRVKIWKEFRKAPDYDGVMDSILNKSSEELNDYLKQNQSKLSKEAQAWVKEEIKEKGRKDTEKESIEENIKDQLEKSGLDPEKVSKILPGLIESFKEPEVRNRFQELIKTEQFQEIKDIIEKTMKRERTSDSVAKTKESIEKKGGGKESPWKTVFGTIGWSILLFLVLFMLAELKGVDYFSGQATGKKKEKK